MGEGWVDVGEVPGGSAEQVFSAVDIYRPVAVVVCNECAGGVEDLSTGLIQAVGEFDVFVAIAFGEGGEIADSGREFSVEGHV